MNRYEQACASLLTALEQNEFDPIVLYELGIYYYADKKFRKVTAFLKRSLRCCPETQFENNIYYHIGIAYARLEKFEKAIYPLTQCVDKAPANILYLHERAKAY
jgi:tetratricopeptide (TPR) repeat protein